MGNDISRILAVSEKLHELGFKTWTHGSLLMAIKKSEHTLSDNGMTRSCLSYPKFVVVAFDDSDLSEWKKAGTCVFNVKTCEDIEAIK